LPLPPSGDAGATTLELILTPFPRGQAFRSELHYSVVKVRVFSLIIEQLERLLNNEQKLASSDTSMLYKRAFRKEKEVITFLMN